MALPQLEGYKIDQKFASGGMANIYDAVQVSLNRPVAIKFLSKQLITHDEAKELFESESLIIAQLNHPNIVQVIDKGISQESQPFFVMEKINGIDLSLMLEQGDLPFGKKLDIAIQMCKGLAYAHKNGVIHRDIKPSNIIIDQHGNVKILDFGIALNSEQSTQEKTTTVVGTQGYVAPEQLENYANATFASDVYSVGILFYELFGKRVCKGHTNNIDRLPADIPQELRELIKKCSHPFVSYRYQSLSEVRDILLKISQGSHLDQTNIKQAQNEHKDLINNFNLLDVLSKSASKQVYLFQKKSTRQLIVIRRTIDDFCGLKEAKYLSSLKHPNIVNILAAVKSKNSTTIITEYLTGGSLSNQLIQDLDEQDFIEQAKQICSALYFAHQNKILHSNLSPNNILIDGNKNLKLSDFGQNYNSNDDPQATRAYQPPSQQSFSEQYDIYCMGAVFHHMLYGAPPGKVKPMPQRKISFRLQKLLDNMLAIVPLNRPASAQQVLVELQRIGNANHKKPRSKMGEAIETEAPIRKKKKKVKQQKKTDHTLSLSIALVIAVLCIIGLIAKDFV